MGNALALRRLLRDLGSCVALCGAALGGLLALAWLAGRDARPPWAVLLGTAAGIALGLVWPSNRARVWRGLRAVGETLYSLALVLGLWVGIQLVVWARRLFRSDARRGGVRGVDRTAPQDESLPRLRETHGEGGLFGVNQSASQDVYRCEPHRHGGAWGSRRARSAGA